MSVRLALAVLLSLRAAAFGQEAALSGRVKGEPRVHPAPSGGAGPYGSRAARYAKLFDYENLKDVVVYAEPSEDVPPAEGAAALTVESGRAGTRFSPAFLAVSAGMILMIAGSTSKCSRLIEGTPYWRERRLVISSSRT